MSKRHVVALMIAGLTRMISGATTRWVNSEPSIRQSIYFANHSSNLDAALLWAALPAEVQKLTRPVAAKDYWAKSAWRRYLSEKVFNAVLITRPGQQPESSDTSSGRAALQAIHDMIEAMGTEHSLIIFPEGTRGTGEAINAFKSGLYHLAKRKPGAALVPVYMENLNRILPKGELLPVPLLSSISFGPAINLKQDETKVEFLQRAKKSIEDLKAT